jgi:hypothetical protein
MEMQAIASHDVALTAILDASVADIGKTASTEEGVQTLLRTFEITVVARDDDRALQV